MQYRLLSLQARTRAMITKHLTQPNQDKGASILEYAAVIVLVAGVAVALLQLQVFDNLVNTLEQRVDELLAEMG
ncbi:hypothetical protein ACFONH_10115 [Streptomonospora nanhaiensis]|uniref:Flp pilus assembly pilin Flp n=2 Tax=Streptomonospora nanhaiensis TaxID=1323731 RepID=A0A853BLM1_9ACTN|nr:hypothetical protein [Streptomonospora nanhaiensis]MBV2363236.1 hypothetical protein [Streptomonospora nanhaiensis]MBX9389671.1 hypothetical protein [Streptomonospora nanhaiensis]NYI95594.1 Flp pilus assembly pilin Flp [Streptomonospora nanhaiensis]